MLMVIFVQKMEKLSSVSVVNMVFTSLRFKNLHTTAIYQHTTQFH